MAATTFGEYLRRLRQDAGLTLEELAEASGLSPRGIGNLERGHRTTPQRGTVAALALGLKLDDEARARLASAAREGRAPDPAPRPADGLPRSVEDFVGRQKELARLRSVAAAAGSGPAPVVALSGPPGAGKTSLALHAARLLAPSFPGGRIML
ncbi:helix-turn-helix domain-containing protein, partial [Actinacidiphila rubida]